MVVGGGKCGDGATVVLFRVFARLQNEETSAHVEGREKKVRWVLK